MIPPSRLPRRPLTPRERAGEVVRGLAALLVLVVVLGGVPVGLVTLVGNPLPSTLLTTPSPNGWLGAPLSPTVVVDVLAVLLWAAWLHALACVAVELRGWSWGPVGLVRVPAGGATQHLARRLLAAVLLLGAGMPTAMAAPPAAPVLTPVTASVPEAGWAVAVPVAVPGTTAAPAPDQGTAAPSPAPSPAPPDAAPAPAAEPSGPRYVVRPPEGRRHDCLWDIAERTLGDPLRYKEIYELNRDRVQDDGSRLVDADLIRPGWTLLLPADAQLPPG